MGQSCNRGWICRLSVTNGSRVADWRRARWRQHLERGRVASGRRQPLSTGTGAAFPTDRPALAHRRRWQAVAGGERRSSRAAGRRPSPLIRLRVRAPPRFRPSMVVDHPVFGTSLRNAGGPRPRRRPFRGRNADESGRPGRLAPHQGVDGKAGSSRCPGRRPFRRGQLPTAASAAWLEGLSRSAHGRRYTAAHGFGRAREPRFADPQWRLVVLACRRSSSRRTIVAPAAAAWPASLVLAAVDLDTGCRPLFGAHVRMRRIFGSISGRNSVRRSGIDRHSRMISQRCRTSR